MKDTNRLIKNKNKRKPISKELRKEVKDFYGNKCVYCNATRHLQIHHVDYDPSNNDFDNLILLCVFCHILHHMDKMQEMLEWEFNKKAKGLNIKG